MLALNAEDCSELSNLVGCTVAWIVASGNHIPITKQGQHTSLDLGIKLLV